MKDLMKLELPLGGEIMTTVRLTTGGICSLAGMDLDASEDCKVCVTESLLLLMHAGYRRAAVQQPLAGQPGLRQRLAGAGPALQRSRRQPGGEVVRVTVGEQDQVRSGAGQKLLQRLPALRRDGGPALDLSVVERVHQYDAPPQADDNARVGGQGYLTAAHGVLLADDVGHYNSVFGICPQSGRSRRPVEGPATGLESTKKGLIE